MTHAAEQADHSPTQGLCVTRQHGDEALHRAAVMAVDYRGDVTLELITGDPIACFVFDCTHKSVRYMTANGDREQRALDQIHAVRFSGKDTAAGMTFDRWIARYVERTLAGDDASLHESEDG